MPNDKVVEARRQTQHKLEIMRQYWGAWCTILAQSRRFPFCPTRLWLVDTHAGSGAHASTTDPDGRIDGTPALAALAARATQRRFPDVEVRVRATDKDPEVAKRLQAALRPYKGKPPDGVSIEIGNVDWVKAVPWVAKEIADEGHPHGGSPRGSGRHDHKSLWFIDPYGVESIDHAVVNALPVGAEVIVNLDLMGLIRDAARARAGEAGLDAILNTAFGGASWQAPSLLPSSQVHRGLADALANSFRRWDHRNAYLLRATGSQDRAVVHLADSPKAELEFARIVQTAFKAGTMIAGASLTTIERDKAAVVLHGRFRGLTLTTRQMFAVETRYSLGQLRTLCRTAETKRYGRWDEAGSTMEWFQDRAPEQGLFD